MRSRVMTALLAGLLVPSLAFAASAQDRIAKGNEFVEKKDYKKAIKEYEDAVKQDPRNSKAELLLGLTYANLGAYDQAIKHIEASARIEPSPSAYHTLGLIYANKSLHDKALEAFRNATKLNPSAYRSWYAMGLSQTANGDFKGAVDSHKKAVSINPAFYDAYLGLGSAAYWAGDKTEAFRAVGDLKLAGQDAKAKILEEWIQEREKRKNEPTATAGASS